MFQESYQMRRALICVTPLIDLCSTKGVCVAGRRCLYLQCQYQRVICEALMVIGSLSHTFVIPLFVLPTASKLTELK